MTPGDFYPMMQVLVDAIADAVADRLRIDAVQDVAPNRASELDKHGVATLLDVSVPTVERHTSAGLIPSYTVGRLRRYNRDAVLAAVRHNKGGCDL